MTPDEYKALRQDAFKSIPLGKIWRFRRTFTDGEVALFCSITGDFNPYHIDDTFAQATRFKKRIIPGLLTASMVTHIGGMIGFLATEMHFEFVGAVYINDTVLVEVEITEKDEAQRLMTGQVIGTNQTGEVVLRGFFRGFPSLVRLQ